MSHTPLFDELTQCLTKNFDPLFLEVKDISHLHEGHQAWRAGKESHFAVTLISHHFEDKSRLERQRMVFAILKHVMPTLHALTLTLMTPREHSQKSRAGDEI